MCEVRTDGNSGYTCSTDDHLAELRTKRTEMMDKTKKYFVPWDAIHEANPQEILDRRERVSLSPLMSRHRIAGFSRI